MLTREQLLGAVAVFDEERRIWDAMDDPSVWSTFQGAPAKCVTASLEAAALELADFVAADNEAEKEAWPLLQKVDAFCAEFERFAEMARQPNLEYDPSGFYDVHGKKWLWALWEEVLAERTLKKFKTAESIQQLMSLRTPQTHEKIAKMYGWYTESGEPDIERVLREIAEPGSEYNPKTWVNRHEVAYWQEQEQWYAGRSARVAKQHDVHQSTTPKRGAAPETLDQLLNLRVMTLQQIMKMRPDITESAILQRASEMGITLEDGSYATAVNRSVAQADEERRRIRAKYDALRPEGTNTPTEEPEEARKPKTDTHPDLTDDVALRVLAMAEEGLKPGQIAAALQGKMDNPPNPFEVGKLLRKHGAIGK